MTDVFQNPSNDYVNPGLAPCSNISDTYIFQFLPKKNVGIVSGSKTVMDMSLSDILVPVTEWQEKKQTLESGEVIYVPGLTKGLLNKTSFFNIPNFGYSNQQFFMWVDLSINYYNNFKNYTKSIDASANYSLNIDIDDALNLAFNNQSIPVSSIYDPSSFSFVGNNVGFDFSISNVVLNIIDASLNVNSPFPSIVIDGERIQQTYELSENKELQIPAVKYPNGAMQGYLMKASYPTTAGESDKWLYMNNVVSPYYNYEAQTIINQIYDVHRYTDTYFDPSTKFLNLIFDLSCYLVDISINDIVINILDATSFDPSLNDTNLTTVDLTSYYINTCIVTDSSVSLSFINNSYFNNNYIVIDSSLLNSDLNITPLSNSIMQGGTFNDSTIINSTLDLVNTSLAVVSDSSIINGNMVDSSIITTYTQKGEIINSSIYESIINDTSIYTSEILDSLLIGKIDLVTSNYSIVSDSSIRVTFIQNPLLDPSGNIMLDPSGNIIYGDPSIGSSSVNYYNISNSIIEQSDIYKSLLSNDKIYNSFIQETSINVSSIFNSSLACIKIKDSSIFNSLGVNTNVKNTEIANSEFKVSIFNSLNILDSSIENSHFNYIELVPGLIIEDTSSNRTTVSNSTIIDASIYNTTLIDCSVYTSRTIDSSLINCTLYNVDSDVSCYIENCKNIYMNASFDCSVSWSEDTSIYYNKFLSKIDVGMSSSSNNTEILSAGEYLDYINSNNLWDKFGVLTAKISSIDPIESNIKNLVGGFYVFNPHAFPVQIHYTLIN